MVKLGTVVARLSLGGVRGSRRQVVGRARRLSASRIGLLTPRIVLRATALAELAAASAPPPQLPRPGRPRSANRRPMMGTRPWGRLRRGPLTNTASPHQR